MLDFSAPASQMGVRPKHEWSWVKRAEGQKKLPLSLWANREDKERSTFPEGFRERDFKSRIEEGSPPASDFFSHNFIRRLSPTITYFGEPSLWVFML